MKEIYYHYLAVTGLTILIIRTILIINKDLKNQNMHEIYDDKHLWMQLFGNIFVAIFSFHAKIWALFILNSIGIIQCITYIIFIYSKERMVN